MTKIVHPALGLDSFSCPHCAALAHQFWFKCFIDGYKKDKPTLHELSRINLENIRGAESAAEAERGIAFRERLERNLLTYRNNSSSTSNTAEMVNFSLSRCHSCEAFSVWINGILSYPTSEGAHQPHTDMPEDAKRDFIEAAAIYQKSPRSAAALLRLAIQKLMVPLGQKGKNLNSDIGNLVKQGLDPIIQKALDVVRVTGNNAVHPGQMDLDDDQETAAKLFGMVNIIVATMITARKQISEMFEDLPQEAKDAIMRRDHG